MPISSGSAENEFHKPSPLSEYKRTADLIARRAAGLPDYDMDDPERPFTPEYDRPDETVQNGIDVDIQDAVLEADGNAAGQDLQERVEALRQRSAVLEAGELALAEAELEKPEDPHASLGGGINTYNALNGLPTIPENEITRKRSYVHKGGKDGKRILVDRYMGGGRYVDVEVDEHGLDTSRTAEAAKHSLVMGGGKRLSQRRKQR